MLQFCHDMRLIGALAVYFLKICMGLLCIGFLLSCTHDYGPGKRERGEEERVKVSVADNNRHKR